MIRDATLHDLSALQALEESSFRYDRISPRQMRHLLTRANATLLLEESDGHLRGALVILWREKAKTARIYSLAVDASARGKGIGAALLREAEKRIHSRPCQLARAEIRTDNQPSLSLFRASGWRITATLPHYYEDGTDAVRVEKRLQA